MSDGPNGIFAFILATLIGKPQLSSSQSKLLKDVRETVNNAGVKVRDFKKDFEAAINIGRDLGLLIVRDEEEDSDEDCWQKNRQRNRSRRRSRTRSRSRSRRRL